MNLAFWALRRSRFEDDDDDDDNDDDDYDDDDGVLSYSIGKHC